MCAKKVSGIVRRGGGGEEREREGGKRKEAGGEENDIHEPKVLFQFVSPVIWLLWDSAVWLLSLCMCMCAQSLQSRPTLCSSMGCSPLGPSAHGILQAGTLELLPCPPPGDLPDPGIKPAPSASPALQADSLPTDPLGKPKFKYML